MKQMPLGQASAEQRAESLVVDGGRTVCCLPKLRTAQIFEDDVNHIISGKQLLLRRASNAASKTDPRRVVQRLSNSTIT